MTLTGAMRVSSSGMTAERFRMDVISTNLANANSMTVNGKEAYRRRQVELTGDENGVKIQSIQQDQKALRREYEPNNRNADSQGYVTYSNIEPIEEMVNMVGAARAYEANIAAFNTARGMIRNAMSIGRI